MFDMSINNGTIVDGTRAPRYKADVGIHDGKVARIGGSQGRHPTKVIDAEDLVVAPGFIDLHTHYDAQINWDPYYTPSSWHDVTSVVLSSCSAGITLRNSKRDERNCFCPNISHVEDPVREFTEHGMPGACWDLPLDDYVPGLGEQTNSLYAFSRLTIGGQAPCITQQSSHDGANHPLLYSVDARGEPKGTPLKCLLNYGAPSHIVTKASLFPPRRCKSAPGPVGPPHHAQVADCAAPPSAALLGGIYASDH